MLTCNAENNAILTNVKMTISYGIGFEQIRKTGESILSSALLSLLFLVFHLICTHKQQSRRKNTINHEYIYSIY